MIRLLMTIALFGTFGFVGFHAGVAKNKVQKIKIAEVQKDRAR